LCSKRSERARNLNFPCLYFGAVGGELFDDNF
jgi:hypothetical protein